MLLRKAPKASGQTGAPRMRLSSTLGFRRIFHRQCLSLLGVTDRWESVRGQRSQMLLELCLAILVILALHDRMIGAYFLNMGYITLNGMAAKRQPIDAAQAESQFRLALRWEGASSAVYDGLGRAYLLQQDYGQAAGFLTTSIELGSHNPLTHFCLGNALDALGDKDRAATEWGRAGGVKYLERLAQRRVQAGDSEYAALLYHNIASLAPDATESLFALGRAYGSEGKWDEAIDAFEQALELDPERVAMLYELGKVWGWGKGNSARAMQYFEQITAIDPDYPYSYIRIAMIHESDGDREEAIAWYQHALTVDPDNTVAQEALERLGAR